jgi:hypothetical protein
VPLIFLGWRKTLRRWEGKQHEEGHGTWGKCFETRRVVSRGGVVDEEVMH